MSLEENERSYEMGPDPITARKQINNALIFIYCALTALK
jgi:hypothetical protein